MIRFLTAFLTMLIIVIAFYGNSSSNNLGFLPSASEETLKICLSVVAMVMGIVFGSLHRQWSDQKGPVSRSSIVSALRSPDLWRSMLLSPIVFSGVYISAKEQPDYVLAFVFAFQTGFFCDKILESRREP